MKVFENQRIFKKLIIVFLSILIISIFVPNIVEAKNGAKGVGGILLDPLMSMFVGLSDGAITLLQKLILHTDGALIQVNSSASGIAKILGIVVAAVIIIGGVAAVIASGGTALAVASGVLTVIKSGAIAGVITFFISGYIANAALPEDFVLPQIKLSPYEIFANQIPLFDVDFFNPMDKQTKTTIVEPAKVEETKIDLDYKEETEGDKKYAKFNFAEHDFKVDITNAKEPQSALDAALYKDKTAVIGEAVYQYFKDNGESIGDTSVNGQNSAVFQIKTDSNTYKIKVYASGTGNAVKTTYDYYQNITTPAKTETVVLESTAYQLRKVVANWYIILRNMSLVALLSILVYVGIRIMISSTAADKSKYKQMLIDWVVAICLLFVLHYIMAFANLAVKKIIDVVDSTSVVKDESKLPNDYKDGRELSQDGAALNKGPQLFEITQKKQVNKAWEVLVEQRSKTTGVAESETEFYNLFKENNTKLYWPTSNFTEQARMMLQYVDEDSDASNYAYSSIGYKLIYCILVIYTFIFVFTYLKRTIYMAFLTLIAPLVALTYPIDKMNDGQAQAFNRWIKEYIFNLLIQPLHLILYMVLIGSAYEFAAKNIIYVVVALGFLTPAEKLLRSFFGFEKAHTPGLLAGPAGAAIMMNGVNRLLGKPPHKGNDGKGHGNSSEKDGNDKINLKDDMNMSGLYGEGSSNGDEIANIGSNARNVSNNISNEKATNSKRKLSEVAKNVGKENDISKIATNASKANGTSGNVINPLNLKGVNEKNKNVRRNRSVLRGFRYVGNKIQYKASREKPLRKLAGFGTGLVGAGVAMTAAGLAGITSGDPSKAAQYMITAGMGGYKLGTGVPNVITDLASSGGEYVEAFKDGYYDYDELKERKIKKRYNELRKDSEFNSEIERNLQKQHIEATPEDIFNEIGEDSVRYGFNANETVAIYQRMQQGYNKDDAMRQVQFVKNYGKSTSSLSHKDDEDLQKTLIDRIRKNSKKGTDEKEIEKRAMQLRKNLDETSKLIY